MSKITIDLVKLIEQAGTQASGSVNPELLQQWLRGNAGVIQLVTVNLAPILAENEAKATIPLRLWPRINDVTTFGDDSELHVRVLASSESHEDQASNAYYALLGAISNIQAKMTTDVPIADALRKGAG